MNRLISMAVVVVAAAAFAQSSDAQRRERCAVRVSIAITGKSPSPTVLSSADPQSLAESLMDSSDFKDRYARFINAKFNRTPGATPEEDAPFYMTWYVLENHKPWSDMFLGKTVVRDNGSGVVVEPDPNGLGYFRSPAWLKRYAGNEMNGVKLSTAYRIYNNIIGLKLLPSTNAPGADITATGREASGCRSCHYEGAFPLDLTAKILTKRVGTGEMMKFDPPTAASTTVLGGITLHDDADLVRTLVNSESYRFNTCRLAFNYLYGRNETTCEALAFDRCMVEFRTSGMLQSAMAAIVKDPGFCQ